MREGWQENFKLVEGDSTSIHTVVVGSLASKAAMLKIGTKSILLHTGETKQVSVSGKTIFITLNEVSDGYARFSISVLQQTPQGGQQNNTQQGGQQNNTQQGGQQNNTQQGGQQMLQDGAGCSNNSACQSGYCSNGYCCASGSCCISDSNCSIGKCNATTHSCFSPTLLSNGAPCNSNADCQSNHCSNGYCCTSGKCCLSNSNCASGEFCNTTILSCVQAPQGYTALDAELKANSTIAGRLITRFASIFENARQCQEGSSAFRQCVPQILVREDKVSSSTFRVIYSYSFSGTSCCPTTDVLVITVELSTNATTTQWIDTSITSSAADSMNASLNSNCASAIQYIACKY